MGTGPILVVDNGTHYLAELERALRLLAVPFRTLQGETPGEVAAAASGVILTGGEQHLYGATAPDALVPSLRLIHRGEVPILGLCLGCQLIAWTHGGSITRLASAVDEVVEVELVGECDIFAGLPARIPVVMAHNDAIVDVGPEIVAVARSKYGEFEAIQHRSRPVFGVQFHPEVSGGLGRHVLANFASLCLGSRVERLAV